MRRATLLDQWRAHAWREAFWDRREADALPARALVIGHGLLAKCVAPFRAITAKALVLPLAAADLPLAFPELSAALDAVAAAHLAALGASFEPQTLLPLPIAALPGWDTALSVCRLFDDVTVFVLGAAAIGRRRISCYADAKSWSRLYRIRCRVHSSGCSQDSESPPTPCCSW